MLKCAPLLVCAWVLSACSPSRPEVLATFEGGELVLAELDAHVRALPEARRMIPPETDREVWLEEHLRAAVLQRLIAADESVRERLASAETQTRRRWTLVGSLAAGVMGQLSAGWVPDDEAVRQRIAAANAREPAPRYDFRHIFLRLDRIDDDGQRQELKRLAAAVARRARQEEDFEALAREHSQSSTAADGGLVQNQRPALLDETSRQALAALAEGEVSPVVESRTGLHIFKLERRLTPQPPGREQLERQARALLTRERMATARAELLAELRQRIEVAIQEFPWRVGRFKVTAADLESMPAPTAAGGELEQLVVEQLLLAEEGIARGLRTPELEARIDQQLRQETVQTAYHERRAAYVASLPEERLRSLYDARPAAFSTPETAHLDLIFVPQGSDPFATQRRLEDHVTELQQGASFAELAREISTGPAAERGGDLGALSPSEWVQLGPEIYKAVNFLQPGEISQPIHHTARILTSDPRTLRGGFTILRVRSKQPPRDRTFEEALGDLRAAYARQHAAEIDREVQAQMLDEADFEILRLPTAEELLL